MWSDERDVIMKLLDNNSEKYPRVCPCCGEKSGHIFFYKHNNNQFGSAWAWCSKCQEYSHSRFLIPSWWKNSELFLLEDLHGCPDNLDNSHESIDIWVNSLRNLHESHEITHMETLAEIDAELNDAENDE